jgi:AAA family ATP:ADP antiporter
MLPLIAIGATSGAAFGSEVVDRLAKSDWIPTESLLLAGIAPLIVSIFLTRIVDSRQQRLSLKPELADKIEDREKPEGLNFLLNGAKLVFQSRFLFAIALLTLLNNWVNTNGENLLFQVVQDNLNAEAASQGISNHRSLLEFTRDGTTAFYGNFFFWVNIVALLLQSLFASRLLKYGGFGVIILFLPVIALVSYSVMALVPILLVVKIMKIAENSVDYSINNTARHVLWLPVDSATKFNAKPAIDTLYVRLGDGFAALTVMIGVNVLDLSTTQFFVFNIALVFLWLFFALMLIREYRTLS